MSTMKKFLKYLLLFIAVYIIVTLLTNLSTIDIARKFTNYEILSDTLKINVNECKTSRTKGTISGTVTNDTDNLISKIYLKVDGYNEKGNYLGSEYKEFVYVYPNDKYEFELSLNWNKIQKLELSIVDEKV